MREFLLATAAGAASVTGIIALRCASRWTYLAGLPRTVEVQVGDRF